MLDNNLGQVLCLLPPPSTFFFFFWNSVCGQMYVISVYKQEDTTSMNSAVLLSYARGSAAFRPLFDCSPLSHCFHSTHTFSCSCEKGRAIPERRPYVESETVNLTEEYYELLVPLWYIPLSIVQFPAPQGRNIDEERCQKLNLAPKWCR